MRRVIFILFFSFSLYSQNSDSKEDFRIDLFTIEKKTKDTLAGSIIEVYSGKNRIETDITDFDGISIFFLKPQDIINNEIHLKIYGRKCKFFEKKFSLTNDLNINIYLEYGITKYNRPDQISEMYKKLKIKPREFLCGTID